jgi:hypothetical protein
MGVLVLSALATSAGGGRSDGCEFEIFKCHVLLSHIAIAMFLRSLQSIRQKGPIPSLSAFGWRLA